MRKWFCISLLIAAVSASARNDFALPEGTTARSISGQFVVSSPMHRIGQIGTRSAPAPSGLLTLEPSLVVVSCERIRQALWRELGFRDHAWKGKIYVRLRPATGNDDTVTVVCNRFTDGWDYQLDMPQVVQKRRFMAAIVQTVLVERANWTSRERMAEIPSWLSEGLVEQLLDTSELELLPAAPQSGAGGIMVTRTVVTKVQTNALENARAVFQQHSPLNLDQLSWPTDAQLSGRDGGVFRGNAQLFTWQLLRLKEGQACMRTMLNDLGGYYNWQTAFLRAYSGHFAALLDVEKWWMLQAANFAGRDVTRMWTMEESRRKLDEMVLMSAEVRNSADELPGRTGLTLQTVVTTWDFTRQRKALSEKAEALGLMRLRLSPEAGALAAEYQKALEWYITQRTQATIKMAGSKTQAASVNLTIRNAVKNLDNLDARRKALGQEQTAAR